MREKAQQQGDLQANEDSEGQERHMAMNRNARAAVKNTMSLLNMAKKALKKSKASCALSVETIDEIDKAIAIARSLKERGNDELRGR